MSADLLEAALTYARWGWPVFPLAPRRKTPAISKDDGGNGHLDATTDENVISQWWSDEPRRNIGISAGPAGLFVVDVDPRNGGDETLLDLICAHGRDWLNTVSLITPSGGAHYYYRVLEGSSIRGGNGLLGVGIDVKSTGGYVVAPPSRTDVGDYLWEADRDPETVAIASLPEWFLQHLQARAARGRPVPVERSISGAAQSGNLTRYSSTATCPACTGHQDLPHGKGIRCAGFSLAEVAYCTREEFAGRLRLEGGTSPPAYKHRLHGPCGCGVQHGEANRPARTFITKRSQTVPPPMLDDLLKQDRVYRFALGLLDLRPAAATDLERRGLSATEIEGFLFRSLPMKGIGHVGFMDTMKQEFGETVLRRAAGFTDKNGRLTFWSAVGARDGYVVPYIDELRRIRGLQARMFGATTKYLTANGSHLADIYHVAGHGSDLYVVEGGLKATVASCLGSVRCFGVAGQALMDAHVIAIRRLEPKRVVVALDREENDQTERVRQKWLQTLSEAGFETYDAVWDMAA